ncbi:unnamed protein product [Pleuronectes platessa]|uniref:Uncharacterized protein n=1 Tax=Pleuronectes platessa TaxID=8262 RepID=A0A9N7YZC2_PLEPL|nr:unnamed protein product [Pleuronectes platessa]
MLSYGGGEKSGCCIRKDDKRIVETLNLPAAVGTNVGVARFPTAPQGVTTCFSLAFTALVVFRTFHSSLAQHSYPRAGFSHFRTDSSSSCVRPRQTPESDFLRMASSALLLLLLALVSAGTLVQGKRRPQCGRNTFQEAREASHPERRHVVLRIALR